jgi:hypothetical protein
MTILRITPGSLFKYLRLLAEVPIHRDKGGIDFRDMLAVETWHLRMLIRTNTAFQLPRPSETSH